MRLTVGVRVCVAVAVMDFVGGGERVATVESVPVLDALAERDGDADVEAVRLAVFVRVAVVVADADFVADGVGVTVDDLRADVVGGGLLVDVCVAVMVRVAEAEPVAVRD